jgi:serine/threonine-protein kinase
MEFFQGESLGTFLDRHGPLWRYPSLMRRMGRDIALAVGAAHAAGVVHRDLKPDNLFLSVPRTGQPACADIKVLDFGIAKLASEIDLSADGITKSGALLGSALYMAPEQILGAKNVDARADIYALGTILYQMAAGRPPFANFDRLGAMAARLTQKPPRLRELAHAVDEPFEALVMKLLAEDPDERPADMEVVATALAEGLSAET